MPFKLWEMNAAYRQKRFYLMLFQMAAIIIVSCIEPFTNLNQESEHKPNHLPLPISGNHWSLYHFFAVPFFLANFTFKLKPKIILTAK